MQPESLYDFLTTEFAHLGVDGQPPIVHSAIRNGCYFVGYLFRCGHLRAVWFVDSGLIKFYGQGRTLLRKVKVSECDRRAA